MQGVRAGESLQQQRVQHADARSVTPRPRRPRRGHLADRVVAAVARWLAAVRHVASRGASIRQRAARAAASPPARCPACRQPVQHSSDWRDHYHL